MISRHNRKQRLEKNRSSIFLLILFFSTIFLNASTAWSANGALSFNGTSDYLALTSEPPPAQMTIEAWINPTNLDSIRTILSWGNSGSSQEIQLRIQTSGQLLYGESDGIWESVTSTPTITPGTWTHIAVTNNGGVIDFYINGSLVADSGGTISGTPSLDSFSIGVRNGNFTLDRYFLGSLDEIRIWNTILDAATISQWYNKEIDNTHPYYANLRNYWNFNHGSGTTLYDCIGGNDGTFVNNPTWTTPTISGFTSSSGFTSCGSPLAEMDLLQGATPIAVGGSYDFGSVLVGSSSSAVTFTIENNGTTGLNLTGSPDIVTVGGTNPGDFTVNETSTTTPVSNGSSTTFTITFTPGGTGARSAEISITNSDWDENQYSFTVQGTGLASAPEIDIQGNGTSIVDGDSSPSTADDTDFGNADVSSGSVIKTFTIENTGNATLDLTGTPLVALSDATHFTVTSMPGDPISASGSTTFEITFDPTAVGTHQTTVTIMSNDADEGTYDFLIQGTGTEPEIDIQGNGTSISDGDNTPDTADDTDFGTADVSSGSVTITYTIANSGNADLDLTGSPYVSLSDNTHFSVSMQPAADPVPASGTTTFQITFNPAATGLHQATVTITSDDDDESSYDFLIQGTGTEPEIDLQGNGQSITDGDATPTTTDDTDFGSVNISAGGVTHTFTIQNSGNGDLDLTGSPNVSVSDTTHFSVSAQPGSDPVPASGSTTFQITFDPVSFGSHSVTVTITNDDDDESTYDFVIQGTGVGPEIDVLGNGVSITDGDGSPSVPDDTDFGNADASSGSVTHTFTIQNTGTDSLDLTGSPFVALSDSTHFSVSAQPGTDPVPASGSTTFQITFNPTTTGTFQTTVSIASDDTDENPYDFVIQGTGTEPEIDILGNGNSIVDGDATPSSTDDTDFGSVDFSGGTVVHTFTISNTGNGQLDLTGTPNVALTTATHFSVTQQPAVDPVPASGSTTFQITFDPSAVGTFSDIVTITNDDDDESGYSFTIQGTGASIPEIDVLGNGVSITDGDGSPSVPDDTDFGNADVSSGSVTHTFTIQNTGSGSLDLTGSPFVTLSDFTHFSVSVQPATDPIPSSGSTTFQITFDPTATGTFQTTVSIANDDTDENPYDFVIQGTGTEPEIDIQGNGNSIVDGDATPSSTDDTDFGSVDFSGGTVVHTFTISNTGNGQLDLTGTPNVALTTGTHFSVTQQPALDPVPASGSTTFQITFDPSAVGTFSDIVTITNDDDDESGYSFTIQGTGSSIPEIDVLGNGASITDGDNTPAVSDDTDFGSSDVSSGFVTHTFTIQNTGSGPLDLTGSPFVTLSDFTHFSVSVQPATDPVPSSGSTTFQITFDPTATGTFQTTVSIANDDTDENPYDFLIQGTGTEPEIEIRGNGNIISDGDTTPDPTDDTDFGTVNVTGGTAVHTFTINNLGNTDLDLTGSPDNVVLTTGTHFTVTTQPASDPINPSGSTTFVITFDPSAAGTWTDTVTITSDDDDESPFTFNIQGTGFVPPAPEIDVQGQGLTIPDGDTSPRTNDDTDFGSVVFSSGQMDHTFTIVNSGSANLNLTGGAPNYVTISPTTHFSILTQPGSGTVNSGGGTVTFTVRFAPTAEGTFTADITIPNDDANEAPYNFRVRGKGVANEPDMNVKGNNRNINDNDMTPAVNNGTDFGGVDVTSGSASVIYTIENTGVQNLTGISVSKSGTHSDNFTVDTTPAASLTPGGTTTFQVTFDPSDQGVRSAEISISSNDPDENPYNFAIQGTGTVPSPEIEIRGNARVITNNDTTPSTTDHTDFGDAAVSGGTVIRTYTINNLGDAALTIGTISFSGADPGDFSVVSDPDSPLAIGGSTTFDVEFNPTAEGTRTADIEIANNDSDENPYTFTIQGNGYIPVYPEMSVEGNGQEISDGDTSPSLDDFTDYGNVSVNGASLEHMFAIKNAGPGNLIIKTITFSGSHPNDFTVTQNPANPVTPGATTYVKVTFDPTGSGIRTAQIEIANNDQNENPYNFTLQGNGATAPEITIQGNGNTIADGDTSPTTTDGTDFGTVDVTGGSSTHTFTILNSGNTALSIGKITYSGSNPQDFSTTKSPASSVAAGGSTTFEVTFNARSTGTRTAEISVPNGDSDENPYNFAIRGSGFGGPPEIDVSGDSHSITDGDTSPSTTDLTDFGLVPVSGGTITHTFTIKNVGTELPLTIQAVRIEGTNKDDFSITQTPASSVIKGSQTTFQVTFDPGATGVKTAEIYIDNNDEDENPYNFAIRGEGYSPAEIDVLGNSVSIPDGDTTPSLDDHTDFGTAVVAGGAVIRTFTIKNNGGTDLTVVTPVISGTNMSDFTLTRLPDASVPALGSTTFSVKFDPSAENLRTAKITIQNSDADEDPYDFLIQGTGSIPLQPEIEVTGNGKVIFDGDDTPSTADSTDFGDSDVTSGSVTHMFVIQNKGTAPLNISSLTIEGGDFKVGTPPGTVLNPNASSIFTIVFDPSQTGTRTGIVHIGNNDSNENPYDFTIQGNGTSATEPEIDVKGNSLSILDGDTTPLPDDLTDFGPVDIDTGVVTHTFYIHNTGGANLILGTISLQNNQSGAFQVTPPSVTQVAPNLSAAVDVTFNPGSTGMHTATLIIPSNDLNENPYDIALQGEGVILTKPDIQVIPSSWTFGSLPVASGSETKTFTVENVGDADLIIDSITISGSDPEDFTKPPIPGSAIPPMSSTSFDVMFDPSGSGSRSAVLHIHSNDPDQSSFDLVLSGTGMNTAPVLDAGQTPIIPAIDEDPTTNNGITIAAMVIDGSITDPDGAVEAVAITASDETHGTWQYSTDNGTSWSDLGAVSESQAMLLDSGHKIRFVPGADFFGMASISFRAWDKTSGTAGNPTDTTTNGGASAYSAETDTAAITVNPLNDPPTIDPIGDMSLPKNAGQQVVFLSGIGTGAANETETLTLSAVSSRPEIIPHPTPIPDHPTTDGKISFTPVAEKTGVVIITVTIDDGQSSNNRVSESFTVNISSPGVTTTGVQKITFHEAQLVGSVTVTGGISVFEKGACWSRDADPTYDVNEGLTNEGAGAGSIFSSMTGLDAGTRYFARAYAVTSQGVVLGNAVTFYTMPATTKQDAPVIERDRSYPAIYPPTYPAPDTDGATWYAVQSTGGECMGITLEVFAAIAGDPGTLDFSVVNETDQVITSSDDSAIGDGEFGETFFVAEPGKTYYVVIWSPSGDFTGQYDLYIHSPGDIGGNGRIDLSDAITSLRMLIGFSEEIHQAGDIHCDGRIDMRDVVHILQNVAELR